MQGRPRQQVSNNNETIRFCFPSDRFSAEVLARCHSSSDYDRIDWLIDWFHLFLASNSALLFSNIDYNWESDRGGVGETRLSYGCILLWTPVWNHRLPPTRSWHKSPQLRRIFEQSPNIYTIINDQLLWNQREMTKTKKKKCPLGLFQTRNPGEGVKEENFAHFRNVNKFTLETWPARFYLEQSMLILWADC